MLAAPYRNIETSGLSLIRLAISCNSEQQGTRTSFLNLLLLDHHLLAIGSHAQFHNDRAFEACIEL